MRLPKKYFYFSLLFAGLASLLILSKYLITTKIAPLAIHPYVKKNIYIIVNPISGGIVKDKIVKELEDTIDKTQFNIEIFYTKAPLHAKEIATLAVNNKIDIVAVVGGDGSVNEVGEALIGTSTILAIIPTGSGNGIARHLHIPQETLAAVDIINKGQTKIIDTVSINDRHYLGVAGIGFDAEVSWEFADFGHRGFLSYLFLTLKKLSTYRAHKYQLSIDGTPLTQRAFLISFANSSQFGNGAFIAPDAKIDDGFLEAVIIKKFPFYATPQIAHRLFHHSINDSEYVEVIKCKEVQLHQTQIKAHIDGEPIFFEEGLCIKILPASLKVLVKIV